jgi:hypothetical protein
MTRRFGRRSRGERLVFKVPHGHWKTSTFVAALRHNRVTAPSWDGPMNGTSYFKLGKSFTGHLVERQLERTFAMLTDSRHRHLVRRYGIHPEILIGLPAPCRGLSSPRRSNQF